jgi:hypothetical protein
MEGNKFDFKCGSCGKVFSSLEDLRSHEEMAHPDGQVQQREEAEEENAPR